MKQFFHNELQLDIEGKVAKGKYFVRPMWIQITKKIFKKLGFTIDSSGGDDMTDREFKVKMLSSLSELKSSQAVMSKSIDELKLSQDKLQSNQVVMSKSIDKLQSNQVVMSKSIDMVNNKVDLLKDEVNNKIDVIDQRLSKLENYHN